MTGGTPAGDPLLRYPGQWKDDPAFVVTDPPQRNLFANGYRWYNPDWGRYTQSDPLLQNTGAHPFSYAHQNPLFFVDPYGLICSEWVSFGHHWTDEEWELDETGRWFPVPIVIPRGGPRTPIGLQLCCRFNIWERQYWGYDQLKRTCDCEDSAGADTYGVYTVREGCDCKRVEFKHANEEFQNYWSSFHVRPECKKVTPGFDCAILP